MKVFNTLDIPVHQLNLIYKFEQQPNLVFVLNTDQDVQYLLEVFWGYKSSVVNIMVRVAAHDASSSRICSQANQK